MAAAVVAGFPASAAVHTFQVTGKVTAQSAPGSDANIQVLDTLTLNGSFQDGGWAQIAADGTTLAYLDSTSTVTLNGLTWTMGDSDCCYDFYTVETFQEDSAGNIDLVDAPLDGRFGPSIMFRDGRVTGVSFFLYPADSSARPILRGGSGWEGYTAVTSYFDGSVGYDTDASYMSLTQNFAILPPNGAYDNFYDTPGFTGVWNFTSSTISGFPPPVVGDVPEPAAWALSIVGVAGAGMMLRRRRREAGQSA